jgi:hypothetical protein
VVAVAPVVTVAAVSARPATDAFVATVITVMVPVVMTRITALGDATYCMPLGDAAASTETGAATTPAAVGTVGVIVVRAIQWTSLDLAFLTKELHLNVVKPDVHDGQHVKHMRTNTVLRVKEQARVVAHVGAPTDGYHVADL